MATRTIVTEGDDVLLKKCRTVEKFNKRLFELLDDMADTLYESEGVGLAAPQVGVRRRVVVIDVGDENGLIELVNPEITERSEETVTDMEGCLSFPGQWGMVERPERVRAKAQDRNGEWFEIEGEGLLARCLCHEIDHLNGVVFKTLASHMLTPEEIDEMIKKQQEAQKQAEAEKSADFESEKENE